MSKSEFEISVSKEKVGLPLDNLQKVAGLQVGCGDCGSNPVPFRPEHPKHDHTDLPTQYTLLCVSLIVQVCV